MPIIFDFSELRDRIVTLFGTCANFAKAANMSKPTLSGKLNNKTHFNPDDIYNICVLLSIEPTEIGRYFFTPKV
jgi:hypothetical protein